MPTLMSNQRRFLLHLLVSNTFWKVWTVGGRSSKTLRPLFLKIDQPPTSPIWRVGGFGGLFPRHMEKSFSLSRYDSCHCAHTRKGKLSKPSNRPEPVAFSRFHGPDTYLPTLRTLRDMLLFGGSSEGRARLTEGVRGIRSLISR